MKIIAFFREYNRNYFNFKLGALGALFLGAVVFIINIDHGAFPALTAALKQAAYTFFFGGSVTKLVEHLSLKIDKKNLAIFTATVIPSLLTIALVFFIHNLKGTPLPFESTLPIIILAPPSFFVIARRIRHKKEP